MSAVNPIDNEDLYDTLLLGGVRSPGIVKLSGHDRMVGWDVQKAKGQKGASMTRTSEDPIAFTASFFLADIDDIEAWPAFLDVINSTVSGPTPKALDIYHPDLAEQYIKSVVKNGTVGTAHDGKGGQTKAVKLIEYFPPKPAGGSPSGSQSKAASKTEVDPNADLKQQLKSLTDQYNSTPWQ
ncbi:MAG: hypothetical protein FWD73_06905 [Polyangiaceae bacterium]|nr:hypothetical protein [Polyangiaceae bacterium]